MRVSTVMCIGVRPIGVGGGLQPPPPPPQNCSNSHFRGGGGGNQVIFGQNHLIFVQAMGKYSGKRLHPPPPPPPPNRTKLVPYAYGHVEASPSLPGKNNGLLMYWCRHTLMELCVEQSLVKREKEREQKFNIRCSRNKRKFYKPY